MQLAMDKCRVLHLVFSSILVSSFLTRAAFSDTEHDEEASRGRRSYDEAAICRDLFQQLKLRNEVTGDLKDLVDLQELEDLKNSINDACIAQRYLLPPPQSVSNSHSYHKEVIKSADPEESVAFSDENNNSYDDSEEGLQHHKPTYQNDYRIDGIPCRSSDCTSDITSYSSNEYIDSEEISAREILETGRPCQDQNCDNDRAFSHRPNLRFEGSEDPSHRKVPEHFEGSEDSSDRNVREHFKRRPCRGSNCNRAKNRRPVLLSAGFPGAAKPSATPEVINFGEETSGFISAAVCDLYVKDLTGGKVKKAGWSSRREKLIHRISNGRPVSEMEFPHMVHVGYTLRPEDEPEWSCGGSLISRDFVLTAAHCLTRPDKMAATHVRLGHGHPQSRVVVTISERIVFPEYEVKLPYHDIGLVKLAESVTFTKFRRPACLHLSDETPARMEACGWGYTDASANRSANLLKVTLPLIPTPVCNRTYAGRSDLPRGLDPRTMFCAGDPRYSKDTCQGDSGGPLQIVRAKTETSRMYSVVGVTSFGLSTCGAGVGVYTRVSAYTAWIEPIVWPQWSVRKSGQSFSLAYKSDGTMISSVAAHIMLLSISCYLIYLK